MKLLGAIYVSPGYLLDKASRDGQTLIQALSECDETEVRDALFNFAISAYHVWDWVKAFRPELKSTVTALLDQSDSLKACRDLCNASKHVTLDLKRRHPVVHDVRTSSAAATSPPNLGLSARATEQSAMPKLPPPWRLKFEVSGRTMAAEELVSEAIGVWETFFAEHHIQRENATPSPSFGSGMSATVTDDPV